ncbi:cytochrome P450 [Coprinopsis marcescibilis]|uniref:Cytochrome P450 n=1 Tax=Coprinopsis marcescibilis TaxID=230819 RepID=A0A5C3LFM4_COPMA|nr:cytochrome P450 [Coprinopsis marcescibilis]
MVLTQVILGLVTHQWFKNTEPRHMPLIFMVLTLVPLSGYFLQPEAGFELRYLLVEYALFYTTLLLSTVVYRIAPFHPLAKHPGPLMCKVTKLWTTWIAYKGHSHRYFKELHDIYGPIVRVGPNELSIVEKDAIPPVLGKHGMPRGPLWDGRRFGLVDRVWDSLVEARDVEIHAELRKPWNDAFSAGPVRDYQAILAMRGERLAELLHQTCGGGSTTVDIAKWISYFAFDFMGDLAFGGSFQLMETNDVDGLWKRMEDGVWLPAINSQIPWAWPIFQIFPVVTRRRRELTQWSSLQSLQRMKMESNRGDLFYHLYEVPAKASGIPLEDQMTLVVSNSILTVLAGADTSATASSAIICYLLARKDIFQCLRDELDEAFPSELDEIPNIEIDKLLRLPYLGAVVNEGLRLVPAVSTHLQRSPAPGSGGKHLYGTDIFIPEGTAVNIPPYAIHRDPRYFSPSPDSFIPERWLSEADAVYITNREAYIPFSHGPANCAGKPIALLELRLVVALLVHRFDMCYKGYRGASPDDLYRRQEAYINGMKDRFVLWKGPLEVEITPRKWKV